LAKRSVAVRIAGQEYRIRSDADEEWLQRVAGCVDVTMSQIREKTGAVDTLDVAMLTCLNLAREVLAMRDRRDGLQSGTAVEGLRLRTLIDLVEAAIDDDGSEGFRSSRRSGAGETLAAFDGSDPLGPLEHLTAGTLEQAESALAGPGLEDARGDALIEAGGSGS